MKTGRSLTELAMEVERQQHSKRDFVADTRSLAMMPDANLAIDGNGEVSPTDYCHGQIANRVQIPKKYYDRMKAESPELLATNVNHWFESKPEKRMVRTIDGKARAFLSNRYRPLDNYDLAQAVLPKIQQMNCDVKSCEVTESHMYLKVVTERITSNVKVGDPVQAGLVISNSEIGAGSLRIEPMIYRLVCLNGMISTTHSMKKYHVGRGQDSDGASEFFRTETKIQNDRAFWMKVNDTVSATLTQDTFEVIVEQMRQGTENRIDKDPAKVVEVVAEQYALNDAEQGGILQHLITGADLSQYGLMNAITRMSQDLECYDRATEMERLGGEVIALDNRQWNKMVA